MLSISSTTVRVFLHVFAATIWVGGQLAVVGLAPTVRTMGSDAARRVARAFDRLAWPAFGVLVATGVWNLMAVPVLDTTHAYQVTVALKLVAVGVSGAGAALHSFAATKAVVAAGSVMWALGAVAALFLGVLLAG